MSVTLAHGRGHGWCFVGKAGRRRSAEGRIPGRDRPLQADALDFPPSRVLPPVFPAKAGIQETCAVDIDARGIPGRLRRIRLRYDLCAVTSISMSLPGAE